MCVADCELFKKFMGSHTSATEQHRFARGGVVKILGYTVACTVGHLGMLGATVPGLRADEFFVGRFCFFNGIPWPSKITPILLQKVCSKFIITNNEGCLSL